jgi:peptide subunit release factor 1 (eRF1)
MISIHIPKGCTIKNLKTEIQSASNIKNKQVRQNTITGLNKIISYL